jgi:hypothetical protein
MEHYGTAGPFGVLMLTAFPAAAAPITLVVTVENLAPSNGT